MSEEFPGNKQGSQCIENARFHIHILREHAAKIRPPSIEILIGYRTDTYVQDIAGAFSFCCQLRRNGTLWLKGQS